jgi:hypothetical protein
MARVREGETNEMQPLMLIDDPTLGGVTVEESRERSLTPAPRKAPGTLAAANATVRLSRVTVR